MIQDMISVVDPKKAHNIYHVVLHCKKYWICTGACIMPALCLILQIQYYAKNYAGWCRQTLSSWYPGTQGIFTSGLTKIASNEEWIGEQGWRSGERTRLPPMWPMFESRVPLFERLLAASPQLNFNPGFFFFSSKALSRKVFSILFRVSYHQIVGKEMKLNLDDLNPASNNPALALTPFVGSLICSERFFSRYSGFPLSSKTNISKFQFDQELLLRRTT